MVAYSNKAGVVSAPSNTVSATPVSAPSPAPEPPGGATTEPVETVPPTVEVTSERSYYVSSSGSDTNAGTQAAPWRTIAHAAEYATAGSAVFIEAGSYPEDVKLRVSGAAGNPVIFAANPGEAASVRSFNVAASHVAIENLTISGSSGSCVSIQPGLTDVVIEGNRITGCGSDGIHFVRPGNPPSSNYTAGSRVVGNTISGVGLSNGAANDMTTHE